METDETLKKIAYAAGRHLTIASADQEAICAMLVSVRLFSLRRWKEAVQIDDTNKYSNFAQWACRGMGKD